jgi:hypothetical protein
VKHIHRKKSYYEQRKHTGDIVTNQKENEKGKKKRTLIAYGCISQPLIFKGNKICGSKYYSVSKLLLLLIFYLYLIIRLIKKFRNLS